MSSANLSSSPDTMYSELCHTIQSSDLNVVKATMERAKDVLQNDEDYPSFTTGIAAEYGRLEILTYLIDHQGFPFDENTMSSAVESGNLEIVKFLLQKGCPMNRRSCDSAAAFGFLDILTFLRQHGCEFNIKTAFRSALETGCIDSISLLRPEVSSMMTQNDIWKVVVTPMFRFYNSNRTKNVIAYFRHIEKMPIDYDMLMKITILADNPDILEYIQFPPPPHVGHPLDFNVYGNMAIKLDKVECLKYLLKYDDDFEEIHAFAKLAATNGSIKVIEYLLDEHNVMLQNDEDLLNAAVKAGQLNLIKFLIKRDFSWGVDTFRCAIVSKNLNVLQFLFDCGCPFRWSHELKRGFKKLPEDVQDFIKKALHHRVYPNKKILPRDIQDKIKHNCL